MTAPTPGKWDALLAGTEHAPGQQKRLAQILENTANHLKNQAPVKTPLQELVEETFPEAVPKRPAVDVGAFAKFALPLIRAATPRLAASDLISVQPMSSPIGGFAFYDALRKPKKTPLQKLTEGTWAVENETDPKPEPSE